MKRHANLLNKSLAYKSCRRERVCFACNFCNFSDSVSFANLAIFEQVPKTEDKTHFVNLIYEISPKRVCNASNLKFN